MKTARYISRFGRYGVQIRPQIYEAYATGATKEVQSQAQALFQIGLLTPEERALALSRMTFNGTYQEQDEVTTIQPDYRIGLFDSVQAQRDHGWPDEIRLEAERILNEQAEMFPNDLIAVLEPVPLPPWPRYDDYTGSPASLLRKLVDEGHDLEGVLAYEQKNQNRAKVTEAIQELLSDPEKLAELQPQLEEVMG